MRTNYAASRFNCQRHIWQRIDKEAEKFGVYIEPITDVKRVPDMIRKITLPDDQTFQKWLKEMKKKKAD